MSLDALFAAAGDDEEVLRRAALIIDLAKAKGAASVEAFGARFFFEQPQPEPPSRTHTQPLQWMMLLQAGRRPRATRSRT